MKTIIKITFAAVVMICGFSHEAKAADYHDMPELYGEPLRPHVATKNRWSTRRRKYR